MTTPPPGRSGEGAGPGARYPPGARALIWRLAKPNDDGRIPEVELLCTDMAKASELSSNVPAADDVPATTIVVTSGKTGQSATVRGVGALKDSQLAIKKGVSLVKPIARQALATGRRERKAG